MCDLIAALKPMPEDALVAFSDTPIGEEVPTFFRYVTSVDLNLTTNDVELSG